MTPEQQQALEDLASNIDIAAGATRSADDAAQGTLHTALDPELCGHISIALQHLWMAQEMLAHMEQGVRHG